MTFERQIKKFIGKDSNKAISFVAILFIGFGLVIGIPLFGFIGTEDEYTRREITTTEGSTAYLIYENGELIGVDITGDGNVDDSTSEMKLWGSTKISDTHVGTELLALDDNGEITFGNDQDITISYDTTEKSLNFNNADLENIGDIDADQISTTGIPEFNVVAEGADPKGEEDITPILQDIQDRVTDEYRLVFPEGEYRYDPEPLFRFNKPVHIVGHDTTITLHDRPIYFAEYDSGDWVSIRTFSMKGITIDVSNRDGRPIYGNTTEGFVIEDFEQVGVASNSNAFHIDGEQSTGIFRNVRMLEGSTFSSGIQPSGFGEIWVINCHFENFRSYGLSPQNMYGRLHVRGGTFKNNGVTGTSEANMRVRSTSEDDRTTMATIIGTTFIHDDIENDKPHHIYLHSGHEAVISGCHFISDDENHGSAVYTRSDYTGTVVIEKSTFDIPTPNSEADFISGGLGREGRTVLRDLIIEPNGELNVIATMRNPAFVINCIFHNDVEGNGDALRIRGGPSTVIGGSFEANGDALWIFDDAHDTKIYGLERSPEDADVDIDAERVTFNDVGRNGDFDPRTGGEWNGEGYEGVTVLWNDNGTNRYEKYIAGEWVEIASS